MGNALAAAASQRVARENESNVQAFGCAAAGLRHSRSPSKRRDELRRELPAPVPQDGIAPRLADNIQLLVVEGFHHAKLRRNAIASARFGKVASIFAPVLNRT